MIVKYRKIWYLISSLLFIGSILVITFWGLPLGIDFTGGNLAEITTKLSIPEVRDKLSAANINAQVQPTENSNILIKFNTDNQATDIPAQTVLTDILGEQGSIVRFDAVGAAISNNLQKKAIIAIVISSLAIILYLAWAFRTVTHTVSSWVFGLLAVLALIHDLTIMTGVFAVLGHLIASISVDSYFITALLTILGYSVNDTIVIFDRVRETMRHSRGDLAHLVDQSITQTLGRSLNTSLMVLLVLIPLLALGSGTLSSFLLALTIGVVVGTYSSIFIAAPLLVTWYGRKR